jgi:DNA-binding NtrC family response regulator
MSPVSSGLPQAYLLGVPEVERVSLTSALEEGGFSVSALPQAPWDKLEAEPCHLVALDSRGGFELAELVRKIKWRCPEAVVLALVPGGQVALAVAVMKSGASACLTLPVAHERLRATAASFKHTLDLEGQVQRLRQALQSRQAGEAIIGQSRALQRCMELAKLVAAYPLSVLLTGESGAGKEAMAALIHHSSGRGEGPFVAVDCGALSEELADDELFGHKKGAFTGAEQDRLGRLQEADQGTLFLDEIGNLPLAQQAKLLRVLQARELWPLGSGTPVPVDLRIVAATNEDLGAMVKEGRFRLDLYHRLSEFSLRVPALRERAEDIEALALYFIRELCQRFGRPPLSLDPRALARLKANAWPGNVRQLQNAMKHACVLAKDKIGEGDLPPELSSGAGEAEPVSEAVTEDGLLFSAPSGLLTLWQAEDRVTQDVERRMISESLVLHRGDKAAAAGALGVHVKTLARKMKAYGLMGFVNLTD